MTKFERAYITQSEIERQVKDYMDAWNKGGATREMFPCSDSFTAEIRIRKFLEDVAREEIWKNDKYQVNIRRSADGKSAHLSIKRIDRKSIHDWRDLQEIKNRLIGRECEAIELYPAESRRVDTANQYHLWCWTDPTFRIPLGWNQGRLVTDDSIGGSVNRPLAEEGGIDT